MITPCDFHTHTLYLRCANETMTIPAMIAKARELGIRQLGVTDHLNTLDKLPLHHRIKADLLALEAPGLDVWFGVELNFLDCDGDFAYHEQVRDESGFQFAIGGIHGTYCDTYDLRTIIDIQHRHHLATCRNPLVDVVVHPYWFGKHEFDRKGWPWFDSVRHVPESYAVELGQVARETGTAIEINGCANLDNAANPEAYLDEYVDYLAAVASTGCRFSLASDAHDISRMATALTALDVAERLGLTDDRIWRPRTPPLVPAGA
ncbi:MAG: PHP domain-containing protein [Kiritimatiellaeota bacterium]|nr:PHP domain-containing protein [Kiritimatiellota bacterium]